jgi:DNA-binding NarL/FixJ family response regulator
MDGTEPNSDSTGTIRVLLVDDHPPLRQGTRAMLGEARDITVVGETGRGEEAMALARALRPDVVLLDIRLQGMSGVDVARALRQDLPEIRIVVLTAHNAEQYVRALFAIGVDGYLLKSAAGEELIAAVRAVLLGKQVVDREVAAQTPVGARVSGIAANPTLSDRECEALTLLARGARNKEVAQQMNIETSTVETHIANAITKLGARSRAEAISQAVLRGIILQEE